MLRIQGVRSSTRTVLDLHKDPTSQHFSPLTNSHFQPTSWENLFLGSRDPHEVIAVWVMRLQVGRGQNHSLLLFSKVQSHKEEEGTILPASPLQSTSPHGYYSMQVP